MPLMPAFLSADDAISLLTDILLMPLLLILYRYLFQRARED